MLPKHELQDLQNLDFASRGEAFVESRFITPLLACLGYETHKDYEVLRHGDDGSRFKLTYPPVERGSQRVKEYSPDYIPTIRKQMFWVIEAKSPKDVQYPFAGNVMVQGLQYCIHPEIQAKYLLISNGEHSSLYDAHGAVFMGNDVYQPILEFAAKELIDKWDQIYGLLSVETLRVRIEQGLKQMYDKLALSSLDKEYPHRLVTYIGSSAVGHSHEIEKKVRQLFLQQLERDEDAWHSDMDASDPESLFLMMDRPLRPGPRNEATYFVDKSLAGGTPAHEIADQLLENFDHQCVFNKLQRFIAVCRLYQRITDTAIKERCLVFVDLHKNAELPLLSQVECAWLRVCRKILVTDVYPPLGERLRQELENAAELIRFVHRPTALQSTYQVELNYNRSLFAELRVLSTKQLKDRLAEVLQIETAIERTFQEAYAKLPASESQGVTGLEHYGVGGRLFQFMAILREIGLEPASGDILPSSKNSSPEP